MSAQDSPRAVGSGAGCASRGEVVALLVGLAVAERGTRFRVSRIGGDPLLLVHGVVGGFDVPASWQGLVPPGYRMIAPSRFGYLGSPLNAPLTAAQAPMR